MPLNTLTLQDLRVLLLTAEAIEELLPFIRAYSLSGCCGQAQSRGSVAMCSWEYQSEFRSVPLPLPDVGLTWPCSFVVVDGLDIFLWLGRVTKGVGETFVVALCTSGSTKADGWSVNLMHYQGPIFSRLSLLVSSRPQL